MKLSFTPVAGAIALLAGVLPAQAQQAVPPSLAIQTTLAAPNTRLQRSAPQSFNPSAALVDRVLVWRGERKSAIVFVAQPGNDNAYTLLLTSARDFRGFLLALGFERRSVEDYLHKSAYPLGEATCLPLEATPQTCIDVSLAAQQSGELTFLAADADRKLIENAQGESVGLALIGSSQLSMGATQGTGTFKGVGTRSLSAAARGVLSQGDARLEYDVAGFTQQASDLAAPVVIGPYALAPHTSTRINLLAAGKRLGPEGGTLYGGLFQSDSGGSFGGGNLFFVRPTVAGVAWKSDGGDLSAFGVTQRVRLLLLSPAFVRIVSQGAQVFEGQVAAGEQIVSFGGYGEPFVDVLVRDASGRESLQRQEVLPAQAGATPVFDVKRNPHGFYADMGRPISQNTYDGLRYQRFKVENGTIASAGYTYAGDWGQARAGVQAGDGFTRVSAAAADRTLARQASVMVGSDQERGLFASYSPTLSNGWEPSASVTDYRAPSRALSTSAAFVPATGLLGTAGTLTGCGGFGTPGANVACYANTSYRSWFLGIGHRVVPVRLSYAQGHSGQGATRTETERVTLQGNFGFNLAGRRSNLLTLLNYETSTRAKSLLMALIVPLENDNAIVTGSLSSDFKGSTSVGAGYSRAFAAPEYDKLRSLSLSASQSQGGGGGSSTGATAYLGSQLGAMANTTSLSQSGGQGSRSTSLQTSFSMDYAVARSGAAFTREDSGRAGIGGLFDGTGQAGVSVINRSQDPQTALVGGRSVVVPAGTSLFVPVGAGYLRGVTVSPGPALNEEEARAGQYLYKGNVKPVVIADGFWVMVHFELAGGKPLPALFTYKRPGEKLERLYMDRQQRAMLYEVRGEDETIERFIVAEDQSLEYRCAVPQAAAPKPGEVSTYQVLSYTCTLQPGTGRPVVQEQVPASPVTVVTPPVLQPPPSELSGKVTEPVVPVQTVRATPRPAAQPAAMQPVARPVSVPPAPLPTREGSSAEGTPLPDLSTSGLQLPDEEREGRTRQTVAATRVKLQANGADGRGLSQNASLPRTE